MNLRAQAEGARASGRSFRAATPVIESDDHVVFFLPNKRLVQEVERLFRVSATFF